MTDDMVTPAFPALAKDEVRFAGDAVAVVVAAVPVRGAGRARGHRGRLHPAAAGARHGGGARGRRRPRARRQGHQQVLLLGARRRRLRRHQGAGGGGRRRSLPAPLHPAAADPERDGAARGRVRTDGGDRRGHAVVVHPDPAHRARAARAHAPGSPSRRSGSSPRTSAAASAPSCEFYREEIIATLVAEQARPAGQVDRVPQRGLRRHDPRPRPDPGHRDHRTPPTARCSGCTSSCWPTWARTCRSSRPASRCWARSCTTRSTSSRRYHFGTTGVFSTKTPTDAYRGAGRPEATYAIERIIDDLAARAGHGPARAAREELDHARGVPVHHDLRARVRQRQLRGGDGAREGAVRVRRAARRAGAAARVERPGAAGHRGLDVHRDVRPRALAHPVGAEVRRRRLGELDRPRPADRQGRGRHRHVAARAGPRDRVEPDRRRRARVSRSTTSRSSTATRRWRRTGWTRTGPARWSSAASRCCRPPSGWSRRRAGSPRTSSSATRATWTSRAASSRCAGTPGAEKSIQAVAFEAFTAHDLPGRRRAHAGRRLDARPEQLLLPARHAPVRGRGRHRDRGRHDPLVRRRRRHRQRRQPDDRRGPGARRDRPGHRAGAVRGGRLRRGRQPGDRHDGRLPRPVRGRPADVRHRADDHPVDHQRARGEGRRRGRHHRLDPGGRQRRRRRAPTTWASTTSAMPCSPQNVWRAAAGALPVQEVRR